MKAVSTTRLGGHSDAPFGSFNCGDHVGDHPSHVEQNRQQLSGYFDEQPIQWLNQVHGNHVHELTSYSPNAITADAVFTRMANQPIAVLTADCLPILLASEHSSEYETEIAAIHAGWRPLASGIVENTVTKFSCQSRNIHAWLGPCIGNQAFEVGSEVREQFMELSADNGACFKNSAPGKFIADLPRLATNALRQLGVVNIYQSSYCTVSNPNEFFSYRRDGRTGRMATVIMKNSLAGSVTQ
ncbi:peptidoglycan editing factor PgeF [Thalassotalea litorea]|uniref:Purine nucleoside phosphorylase n=1 Tax=Thalassotalea litorea TaxID=2020715 RepID=A0A5R9IDR5_9GAMM|nr:peptidoglycan editing factor PgeF [Thalassotalea litorea]